MNLDQMIDRLVEERLNARLAEMLGAIDGSTPTNEPATARIFRHTTSTPITRSRPSADVNGDVAAPSARRSIRPQVGYVLTARQRPTAAQITKIAAELPGTFRRAYLAIAKSSKPITARTIETITNDKMKTVQSAVYHLRRSHGLVKSVTLAE